MYSACTLPVWMDYIRRARSLFGWTIFGVHAPCLDGLYSACTLPVWMDYIRRARSLFGWTIFGVHAPCLDGLYSACTLPVWMDYIRRARSLFGWTIFGVHAPCLDGLYSACMLPVWMDYIRRACSLVVCSMHLCTNDCAPFAHQLRGRELQCSSCGTKAQVFGTAASGVGLPLAAPRTGGVVRCRDSLLLGPPDTRTENNS